MRTNLFIIAATSAAHRTTLLSKLFSRGYTVPQLSEDQQNAAAVDSVRPFSAAPHIAIDPIAKTLQDAAGTTGLAVSERKFFRNIHGKISTFKVSDVHTATIFDGKATIGETVFTHDQLKKLTAKVAASRPS